MATRTLGQPEKSNNPILYIPGWVTGFRTGVNSDDAVPNEVAVLGGDKSRFGVGNVAIIDVIATGTGVVVELWAKEGSDLIFVATQTTAANKQRLVFNNLAGTAHFTRLTGAAGKAVTLNAGITQ